MKVISRVLPVLLIMTFCGVTSTAQVIDPEKSAKAAAANDAQFISDNILDDEDMMFLSRKAIERATHEDVKELAKQMLEDHSEMLYAMQHIQTAGGNSSHQSNAGNRPAVAINTKLSEVSGYNFDTTWVSGLLALRQAKYDELSQAKETVTNPQLKMAITQALPFLRKHVTKLKSLQKALIREEIQRKKEEAAKQKQGR